MKLKPLPPTSVIPMAELSVRLEVWETTLNVLAAELPGSSVSVREIPLSRNVCSSAE